MATNRFNFSPAGGDQIVHGSCRPGAAAPTTDNTTNISSEEVAEWVAFMKSQGIERVVSLLESSEISESYACDLPAVMEKEFIGYTNVNVKEPGAGEKLMAAVSEAAESNQKVVVHCWGGGGRTGNALAAWSVFNHKMAPEEAAEKVLEAAAAAGASRRVDTAKLDKFMP